MQEHLVTTDWEFAIVACDGIWDVMSNEEVVAFVRGRLAQGSRNGPEDHGGIIDPEEVCEELMSHCLAPDAQMGTGCDNMTVVLVCFLHGKPYSHLVARCQQPPNLDP